MKSISRINGATSTPALDLDTLKADLRISGDALDDVLTCQYIPAAQAWAERETGRSLISRTIDWIVSDFPGRADNWTFILPGGKVTAIASIDYSINGSIVTLTGPSAGSPGGTDYAEDISGPVARIMPNRGESWPTVDNDVPQPVKVTYTAGWPNADAIPADLRRALTAYVYGAMELDGLLVIRPGFDADFADKLLSGYRSARA